MAVFQNNLLAGAGAQSSGGTTHTIDQSIRFNSADSAYMYKTPSSASNRRTWTVSCWFKLATDGTVFERYANGQIKIISNYTDILQRKALRVNIGKDGILDFIEYF